MVSENFIRSLSQHIQLNDEERRIIRSYFIPQIVKQNTLVATSGRVSEHFIHVISGCLMFFHTDSSGTDHVIQFPTAGWWTGDLRSLNEAIPSVFSIKALADSELFTITKPDLDQLLLQVPALEKYFRIIFQNALVSHQHRIIQNFSLTAEERYESFLKKYPTLEQYVPLKYIASYLGITPEFLSKVRRNLMKK